MWNDRYRFRAFNVDPNFLEIRNPNRERSLIIFYCEELVISFFFSRRSKIFFRLLAEIGKIARKK